jgi:hypothetical protein
MEYWSIGVMEYWNLEPQYSITPRLHYSKILPTPNTQHPTPKKKSPVRGGRGKSGKEKGEKDVPFSPLLSAAPHCFFRLALTRLRVQGSTFKVQSSRWDCYRAPPLDTAGHSSGLLGVIGESQTVSPE